MDELKSLNKHYDRLQQEYGAANLCSIYNGGCSNCPDICFVFMNPTGRNVASDPSWTGLRSPWTGAKNIWKVMRYVGLIDNDIFKSIANKRPSDWDEEFANTVYDNVARHKVFITNLAKCTQVDARPLPNSVYRKYLALLKQEIDIVKPRLIIAFGNQVSTVMLGRNISVSQCRKKAYELEIGSREYKVYPVYPVYYPVGNGTMNIDKALEDLKFILKVNSIQTELGN